MNKKLLTIIIGVVLVAGVSAAIWYIASQRSSGNAGTATQTSPYGERDACHYLTQDIADKVLGSNAQKGADMPGSKSDDIQVSICTYTAATDGSLESVRNLRTATLLVRSPLSQIGTSSNEAQFNPPKEGAENVPGYGEAAYWDSQMGQLNVLKNETWVILSVGPPSLADKSLTETKQLADLIVPDL